MKELIAIIILGSSLIGIGIILFRKIPLLLQLPEVSQVFQEPLNLRIKKGIKKILGIKDFSYELFLQKMLSRMRILTLKTENRISGRLERLRQKVNQKNHPDNDDYWEELKKAKNGR